MNEPHLGRRRPVPNCTVHVPVRPPWDWQRGSETPSIEVYNPPPLNHRIDYLNARRLESRSYVRRFGV